MALYIARRIFHLARLFYVRPETIAPSLVCTFTIISRSVLVRMGYVSGKSYRGNQNTYFMLNNGPPPHENLVVCETMRKNILEQDRPHMTVWHMRIACWIPKGTNTLSYCFCSATIVARTRFSVALYVHCLSCWPRVRCL